MLIELTEEELEELGKTMWNKGIAFGFLFGLVPSAVAIFVWWMWL